MILSLVDLSSGFSFEFNFLYVSEFIYISVSCFLVFVSSLCLSCPLCICFPSHVFVYSLSVSCLFSYLHLSPSLSISLPCYLCLSCVSVFHLPYQFSCSCNRENWAQDCISLCWGLNAKLAGPVSLNTIFKLASDEAVPSVSLLDGLKTDNVDPEFALVSNVNVKLSKELFF